VVLPEPAPEWALATTWVTDALPSEPLRPLVPPAPPRNSTCRERKGVEIGPDEPIKRAAI
jgi:hypothetical protein